MRVYISGALQSARNLSEARSRYELLARELTRHGLTAYLPHTKTDPRWAEESKCSAVYHTDVQQLAACDAIVAFLDEPSLGVGAEIALGCERQMPVVGLSRELSRVSRFIRGLLECSHRGALIEYDGIETAARRVAETLGVVSHATSEALANVC